MPAQPNLASAINLPQKASWHLVRRWVLDYLFDEPVPMYRREIVLAVERRWNVTHKQARLYVRSLLWKVPPAILIQEGYWSLTSEKRRSIEEGRREVPTHRRRFRGRAGRARGFG